jgi:hypothetical protein
MSYIHIAHRILEPEVNSQYVQQIVTFQSPIDGYLSSVGVELENPVVITNDELRIRVVVGVNRELIIDDTTSKLFGLCLTDINRVTFELPISVAVRCTIELASYAKFPIHVRVRTVVIPKEEPPTYTLGLDLRAR